MLSLTQASSTEIDDLVIFRPMVADDAAFVFNSWLKSFRDSEQARRVAGPIYFQAQHDLIERLLSRSHGVVAAAADEPSQILGYIAGQYFGSVACIHYLYVKQTYRRMGVASRLLALATHGASGIQHSHETKDGRAVAAKLKSYFNPYLCF